MTAGVNPIVVTGHSAHGVPPIRRAFDLAQESLAQLSGHGLCCTQRLRDSVIRRVFVPSARATTAGACGPRATLAHPEQSPSSQGWVEVSGMPVERDPPPSTM